MMFVLGIKVCLRACSSKWLLDVYVCSTDIVGPNKPAQVFLGYLAHWIKANKTSEDNKTEQTFAYSNEATFMDK